jgi:tRNA 2-selenouridine synthase
MQTLTDAETLRKIISGHKIIDVRAPVEFTQGALPNSVNIPVLDDRERALVGTCYKNEGREAAIQLGYKLVSGENLAQKRKLWTDFVNENPGAILTCFRGGLRSKNTQSFLHEVGIQIPRVEHGYKNLRAYLTSYLEDYARNKTLHLLTGNTGSGKTHLLQELAAFYPAVDLENLALHRGSAFGKLPGKPQPAQASFENALAVEIYRFDSQGDAPPVLFEDESRVIGSLHLPEPFFNKMRESNVICLKVPIEKRIENIFNDYINLPEFGNPEMVDMIFDNYLTALGRISKKLGGLRTAELEADLTKVRRQIKESGPQGADRGWIEKFLVWYYDPMYEYSFDLRKPVIEFSGDANEITAYLRSLV